ncbi:MAG: hypothetical protein K1Y02_19825 [Candidatus Hydrogenedentes bacterium]|nr:hypothetical protein [Candidatus Hydrogenedentota bacterium]
MPQTYRYRKHVRWVLYKLPFAAGLLFAFKAVLLVSLPVSPNAPSDALMGAIIYAAGAFVMLIYAAIGYFRYGYEGSCFTLYENELVWTNGEDFKYLRYNDIDRIDSQRKRLGRSRVRIITSDNAVQLSTIIENAGELILDLKRELDKRGLQHRYDQEELLSFLKDAAIFDQNWERLPENFLRFMALAILWSLTGFVVAVTAGGGTAGGIIAAVISFFFALVPQYVTDRDCTRRISYEANLDEFTCPARDKEWEKRTFKKALLLTALIYACIYAALILAAHTLG